MRILVMLVMAVILVGCGTANNNEVPDQSNNSSAPKMGNQSESTVTEEPFILTLRSEKEQYKVGEELNIQAELTYTGDEEISIGHGASWLSMSTMNVTKGYDYGSAMNEPYIITPMKPNTPIIQPYSFSGGGGDTVSKEEFEQMAAMNFPPGQYKIEGVTRFVIDGEQQRYNLKAEIVFEVIE